MNEVIKNDLRRQVRKGLKKIGPEVDKLYTDREINSLIAIFMRALIDFRFSLDIGEAGLSEDPDYDVLNAGDAEVIFKAMLRAMLEE